MMFGRIPRRKFGKGLLFVENKVETQETQDTKVNSAN